MKYALIIICALAGLSGCRSTRNNSAIVAAEELMQEQPDSALTLLQSIDPNSLRGEKRKARFALLYSQALDKNYIDTANDSLIHPAVKYFEHHGTNEDKYLAFYYLGRVQCNAQDYINAVISFTQAKDYAEKQGDHYFLGLIYSQLGDIYGIYYNYPGSIEAYKEAYNHYSRTTNISHQQYARLDMAAAYMAAKQYDQSILILSEMLNDPEIKCNISLQADCLSLMAANYDNIGKPSKAKEILLSKQNDLNEPFSINDFLILAHVYSIENKLDSMGMCLAAARHFASTDKEEARIIFTEYKINKYLKNNTIAFERLEKCMFTQDSVARLTLNQSIVSAQRDYYEGQSEFATYKLKVNKRQELLLLCIFILIIAGLITGVFHMRKIKNMKIAEYMAIASRIQDSLQSVQESLQEKEGQQSQMSSLIQHLFKEKFDLIDRLGTTYYERQNSTSERDAIFNDVKTEIKKLGSDKGTKLKLEQIVNACKGGVMQKLREQLPEIKEEDFEFLCYIYAGFSCRAISIFTQDKVENIYTRKSRLKTKITKSNAPDSDFFVDMIS